MAHIYEKKSLKMSSLNIIFDRAGIYEKDGEYGTSHLMEHLICETFKEYYPTLNKYNIAWNASTGSEFINVYFTGLDKYLTPELKQNIVKKLLGGLNVTEERFNGEKEVVLQEYMDSFNDPECWNNIIRQKYDYYGAIGRRSDIEKFTHKDMQQAYKKYFQKPSKIIEVGPTKSDFSFVKFADKPVDVSRKLKFGNYKNVELEPIPENQKSTIRYLSKKMLKKSDYPAMAVALNILAGGLDSPMYKRIREEKTLTYHIGVGLYNVLNDTIIYCGATTDKSHADELRAEFQKFFKDITKYIKKDRFENEITALTVNAEMKKIFRYKNVGDIIRKGLPMVGNAYKKLTLAKVKEVAAKYLNLDNMKEV